MSFNISKSTIKSTRTRSYISRTRTFSATGMASYITTTVARLSLGLRSICRAASATKSSMEILLRERIRQAQEALLLAVSKMKL